jgi:hypothetical protein
MAGPSMKVEGFEQLQATLSALGSGDAVSALRAPMTAAGSKILAQSKAITPRMDGQLVNSALMQVDANGSKVEVTLGYNTPYAAKVHENPRSGQTGGVSPSGQRYRKWARVGGYKYLEKPMTEAAQWVWPEVARGVESWIQQHAR